MNVIKVNKENFKSEVIDSNQSVLVDFYAQWCGPCKMLRPIIDEIAGENSTVKFVSIDIDEEIELAEEYNVSSVPCLVLFEKGNEVKRSVGLISKDDIVDLIGG